MGTSNKPSPEVVATDVIDAGEWIDRVVDARELPFADGEVGNFVMIDVLHHLPRPLNFLRAAAASLQPGGRIVLLEPAATPWARLVLGACHHEPVDKTQDLFAEDGTPEPPNEGFTFANQAIATLLFVDNPAETAARVPELELVAAEHSDFVVYPATGGFSYLNLMLARFVQPLYRFERKVTKSIQPWTGMRLLVGSSVRRSRDITLHSDSETPGGIPVNGLETGQRAVPAGGSTQGRQVLELDGLTQLRCEQPERRFDGADHFDEAPHRVPACSCRRAPRRRTW